MDPHSHSNIMSHRHLPTSTSTLKVDTRGAEILDEDESNEASDIYLPKHTEFISHIALDIGGSLAKVVYFTRAAKVNTPSGRHNRVGLSSSHSSISRQSSSNEILRPSNHSHSLRPLTTNDDDDDDDDEQQEDEDKEEEEDEEEDDSSSAKFSFNHSRSTSNHSKLSSDPESPILPKSRPQSSNRSSISQPNGILNPTLVREKIFNSNQLTEPPSFEISSQHPSERSSSNDHHLRSSFSPIDQLNSIADLDLNDPLASATLASSSHRHHHHLDQASKRSSISSIPGGRLNFIKFETDCIDSECIPFISNLIQVSARSNGVPISTMKRAVKIIVTGGGAYVYADLIKTKLGGDVEVLKEDEMDCLITGLNFITEIPNEVFWFSDELVQEIIHNNPQNPDPQSEGLMKKHHNSQIVKTTNPDQDQTLGSSLNPNSNQSMIGQEEEEEGERLPRPSPNPPQYSVLFESNPTPQFPCMLVNIGSGVSIIKVTGFGKFERISGTSLGGGTLWGLLSLLTNAKSFDEMLELSMKGDNSKVDMLVGDIYGQDYNKIGLKSSTIASSFGKVFKKKKNHHNQSASSSSSSHHHHYQQHQQHPHQVLSSEDDSQQNQSFKPEDISKSLLYAISNNIGQITHLNAEKHGLDRIYFGGCFIRGHAATVSTLSYAIRFWSKGKKRAYFLRHEGYLGSVGAWLKNIADHDHHLPSSSTITS